MTNATVATDGAVAATLRKEREASRIHSRGPLDPSLRGSSTLRARVFGAARTNKIGASTASVACWTRCMLRRIGPYTPGAPAVAHTTSSHPPTQAAERRIGHTSPLARTFAVAVTYRTHIAAAKGSHNRSGLHWVPHSATPNVGGSASPSKA